MRNLAQWWACQLQLKSVGFVDRVTALSCSEMDYCLHDCHFLSRSLLFDCLLGHSWFAGSLLRLGFGLRGYDPLDYYFQN